MKRIYDLVNAALLGLIAYSVLSRYGSLPDRIPTHFDIAGNPDRWGPKAELFVFVAVSLGLTILFYAFILAVPRLARNPQFLNIPAKEEFLKLSPEKQRPYWELLQEVLAGMAVSVNLIFLLTAQGTLRIVQGKSTSLAFKDMLGGFAALALIIVIYLPRLMTLPRRLSRGEGL